MQENYKTKILFVYQDLDAGGAEEVLASTVRNINKVKYSVKVCCLGKKQALGCELEKEGYDIVAFNLNYGIFSVDTCIKLYKLIREYKPQIVHASLFYANFHARLAGKLARVPVILIEEQNVYEWKSRNCIYTLIDKIMSYFTDKIIACSMTVKDFTARQEGIKSDKFTVIHNTIHAERFNTLNNNEKLRKELGFSIDENLIGTIGRLCEQKGQVFLIEAMLGILKEHPNSKLIIVGEGPLEHFLKKKSEDLGLSDNIVFLKKTREISKLLTIFDIFVLPSLWEGLSVVLLEAMYMKKPIIATDISSNKEAMIDNETGMLVSSEDHEVLSKAIVSLLDNEERKRQFGYKARKRIEEYFGPKVHIKKLEELYESIIAKKGIER